MTSNCSRFTTMRLHSSLLTSGNKLKFSLILLKAEEIPFVWLFYLSGCSIHACHLQKKTYGNYTYAIGKEFRTVTNDDSRPDTFATPPPPILNHRKFSRTVMKTGWKRKPADVLNNVYMLQRATIPQTHTHTHTVNLEQHKTWLLSRDNKIFQNSEHHYKLSQISTFWIMQ